MKSTFFLTLSAVCAVLTGTSLQAEIRPASVFSHHMVLQRDMKVPVWGKASPGGEVLVEFAGQRKTTKADTQGKWRVNLDPMPANATGQILSISSGNPKSAIQSLKFENVPIGLINSSYGGTPAEAWMSEETMKSNPACAPTAARLEKTIANWPRIMEEYRAATEAWTRESEAAKAAGIIFSKPRPRQPVGANHPYAPVGVYNAMLHPLIPTAIRGVVWYQGEANVKHAEEYQGLFTALILQWRSEWNQGDFPFYFVQLANFKGAEDRPDDWAWLREAQVRTLEVPNTGMAVAIDIGDPNDIHPRNKQDVGKRLALLALNKTYGQTDLECAGPLYERSEPSNSGLKLFFKNTSGLQTQGGAPAGFEIAGDNKNFLPATA
jgi:sialate O-acetylesterase